MCPAPGGKLAVHFFKQSLPPLFSAGASLLAQGDKRHSEDTLGRNGADEGFGGVKTK